jgi:hypothetical protein
MYHTKANHLVSYSYLLYCMIYSSESFFCYHYTSPYFTWHHCTYECFQMQVWHTTLDITYEMKNTNIDLIYLRNTVNWMIQYVKKERFTPVLQPYTTSPLWRRFIEWEDRICKLRICYKVTGNPHNLWSTSFFNGKNIRLFHDNHSLFTVALLELKKFINKHYIKFTSTWGKQSKEGIQ